jgi:Flp pilus assembly pilin Flp
LSIYEEAALTHPDCTLNDALFGSVRRTIHFQEIAMLNLYTHLVTLRRQRGLTAVEYAVAGGLIVVAIAAAVAAFGPLLKGAFEGFFAEL